MMIINNKILELYDSRRKLMINLLDHVGGFTESTIANENVFFDTYDLMGEMVEIITTVNELCDSDYVLVDMYRRLSLALSREYYEEASLIKEEIINHKS